MNKKRLAVVGIIPVICAVVILYRWTNSTNVATLSTAPVTSAVQGVELTLVDFRSNYAITKIPNYLRIRTTSENPSLPIVGQYLLTEKNIQFSDQIGITIGKLPGGNILDASPVKLRSMRPDLYQLATESYAPAGALVYSAIDGYEKGIFWTHNGYYAAVVVSGTADRRASLEQSLSSIVVNWQWSN